MQMIKNFKQIQLLKPIFLLHILEQAAWNISLYENTHKTEYMYFDREKAIFILNGGPLKLVDMFRYLGSSISSTESDVNIRLAIGFRSSESLIYPIK